MAEVIVRDIMDATAYDRCEVEIGPVREVFLDDASGQPTFALIGRGLFNLRSALVPLRGSRLVEGKLILSVSAEAVASAPAWSVEDGLTEDQQQRIYEHFALTDIADGKEHATNA